MRIMRRNSIRIERRKRKISRRRISRRLIRRKGISRLV